MRVLEIGLAAGEVGGVAGTSVAFHRTIEPAVEARLAVSRASGEFRPIGPAVRGTHVGFVLNAAIDRGLRALTKPEAPFLWGRGTAFPAALKRAIAAADIVQVYWNDRLLGVRRLAALAAAGKPVVLVLMDFEPFTGGCHYPLNGCEGYLRDCARCPVSDHPYLRKVAVRNRAVKAGILRTPGVSAVVGNEWFRERLVAAGCAVDRTHVIYPPIADCYHLAGEQRAAQTERTAPDDLVLTIGATALDSPRKGVGRALEIAQGILAADGRARLVIVGRNCPPLPGDIANRTTVAGMLSEQALADVLASTDVFLSASTEDAGPMMVAAAWAAGASVASTRLGYASDLLSEGMAGRFLDGTLHDQTEAVRLLLADRGADRAMAVQQCLSLGARFSSATAQAQFCELYDAMLATRG